MVKFYFVFKKSQCIYFFQKKDETVFCCVDKCNCPDPLTEERPMTKKRKFEQETKEKQLESDNIDEEEIPCGQRVQSTKEHPFG